MPRIRRKGFPRPLMEHLSLRVLEREISLFELRELAQWLDKEPIAPEGRWFKRFGSFIVCGEGEWVKTVLTAGQIPSGTEMR